MFFWRVCRRARQYRSIFMPSGQNPTRKRILIVDDHPMTRSGLVHLISNQPDLEVCGEAENAAKALSTLNACEPDLALIDITLPDKSGLELIKDLKAIHPQLPILVISMHDESLYAERVLRAGARGYIAKREGGEKLLEAIRRVASGYIYLSETMSGLILELFCGGQPRQERSYIQDLSDREFEVFELIGAGLSTREIAAKLHLSAKTVQAHRANVKQKLNIKTTPELISYAARWIEHSGEELTQHPPASVPHSAPT
jgi:DNA-binding NarL/FixJ family response regulator